MQINAKNTSIITVAIIAILAISYIFVSYTSSESVWKRQESSYRERLEEINRNIEALRLERKENERLYLEKDSSLSGAINEGKAEYEKIKLCLESRSIDCDKADKKAMISLIPTVSAESIDMNGKATPTSSLPPTSNICTIGT